MAIFLELAGLYYGVYRLFSGACDECARIHDRHIRSVFKLNRFITFRLQITGNDLRIYKFYHIRSEGGEAEK